MNRHIRSTGAWSLVAVLLGVLLSAPAASATPQEEQQGSQILSELESGKLKCSDASATEFELVGEYAMGRMFGSSSQHEAMDQMMSRMMGARGEESAHEAMGRRFSGCGGGQLPAGFGRMMGAVNAMGIMGGGMMGGANQGGRSYGGYGSMMDGYSYGSSTNTNDEGSDGPSAAAMVGVMAVLIGALALALLWLRPRRRPGGSSLDLLQQRFARGELTEDEYRDRKRLLEGG